METKPKLDVAALVKQANDKTKELKKSTEKVNAIKDDYKIIPAPFSGYEINSKNVVRNVKTKMAQSFKKGTGKFYLNNDSGERKLISLPEIKASILAAHINKKTEKPIKEPKIKISKEKNAIPRDVTNADLSTLPEIEQQAVKSILSIDASKYVISWRLHLLGYSNQQIASWTNVKIGSVSRDIWLVNQGHRPKPE